ncbi:TPA: single-stranded DNA-binding protein [Enterococcus faecium]|uniref:Single-stranded DNA-binding protein n=2 Tax=Enterococcus TaxID=1350 RepID=R2QVN2_9ENTE|nr:MULTISPECIES: single-stranded DNA-binding protein [Enterococcus]HAQ3886353.1 single-stranded DNA-binding protein [Enterococcus faecium]HDU2614749.1 single-stranded DNA-binding protein [Enterococcus faecalis]EOH75550.1 single-stranded DNA-binding protein [Enterococcus raffinosus ATCC 49464]EOT70845.1 single-strand binding protein [Enterococcus raffinosus ATCC 49464]EZP99884.1 single-stranded DNA-binding protein [Enterococcus faecium VRE0576]
MINVHAVGRLTKGAELRTTNNGKSVANFTLACKRKRPDKDGKLPTTFVQCVLWGKPAQAFAKFTQKGALIGANGELQTRSYDDQQGITHYVTELVVEDFEFLESKETVQNREQKQQGIPQSNQIPPANEPAYMNQEPPYEQPPLNGMSEYGYNQ